MIDGTHYEALLRAGISFEAVLAFADDVDAVRRIPSSDEAPDTEPDAVDQAHISTIPSGRGVVITQSPIKVLVSVAA